MDKMTLAIMRNELFQYQGREGHQLQAGRSHVTVAMLAAIAAS